MAKILRRTLLVGSAAVAGGVAFGYWRITKPYPNPLKKHLGEGEAALTPYVLINQDGVTIVAPRAEMGQGVRTTLAALVAEELDIALDDVAVIHGPTAKAYFNGAIFEEGAPFRITDTGFAAETARDLTHVVSKLMAQQTTGGSSSTPDAFVKMRKAGAAARAVLVEAAARQLGVRAATLTTENGAVAAPDGTRIAYTDLAVAARNISPPRNPPLKPRSAWRLLGKSQTKVDMADKCTGRAHYANDVRLPGMMFASVRANPHLRADVASYDDARAKVMPGVAAIVAVKNGVAAVANNSWAAMQAVNAVDIKWRPAPYPQSTKEIREALAASFNDPPESQKRDDGDVDAAMRDGAVVETQYAVPYLAHATMEPMSGAAFLRDDKLDLWVGSQAPTRCLKVAEALTGLSEDNIEIHNMFLGGGFGRRGETDFVTQVIEIAQAMEGTPVSLSWTREEDMRHDMYRPMALATFRGAHADGAATAFDLHLASSPAALDAFARNGTNLSMPEPSTTQNAWDNPYTIENYRVSGYRGPTALPVGFWRAVGASQNGFFQECAMDELAHSAGVDPIAFRLRHLAHEPSRKVLEKVAQMADWGGATAPDRARGVAYFLSFGVPVAEIIEVERTSNGLRLTNIWAAADVGLALDPGNVEAQIQSGIIYGLTAAIYGEITVEDGKVAQSNFHDYEMLRMHQTPPIHVAVLENGETIRGVGEPGLPPAAPALANAVFAATGARVRELPLKHAVNFV